MSFYAAKHYYGIEFANDYSTLFRFNTKAERDAFVIDSNFDESATGAIKTEALTYSEARRHFGNAFRMVGNFHDVSDMRDWIDGATETSSYWCKSNLFYSC